MTGLIRAVLDLLFPRRCLGCNHLGSYFCLACSATLVPVPEALCPACRLPVDPLQPQCRCRRPALLCLHAAAEYHGPIRTAIHRFKYDGQRAAAADLGVVLERAVAPYVPLAPLLVPVPLHPSRRRQRGYNQSALLAAAAAKARGLRLAEGALRRVRATPPQVGLSALARATNLAGAFAGDPAICTGQDILLVDDVCTTGATLHSAAIALRRAGARHVYAAVLAIAVDAHRER